MGCRVSEILEKDILSAVVL